MVQYNKKKISAGRLFVVSAPSGAGKTSVVTEVVRRYGQSHAIERVVTYTTKEPRPQEQHGIDYYFLTEQEFECKIAQGDFLEWSNAYGAYYGSPRSILQGLEQGRSYIVIADRAGAAAIKQVVSDVVLIWLYTQSLQVLQDRLTARKGDSQVAMERRLALARQELACESAAPLYEHHICNEDFFDTVEKISALMMHILE